MSLSDGQQSGDSVILNKSFKALRDPIRRGILLTLREKNPCTVEDLTSRLSEQEGQQNTSVAVELHHVHLPLLDEADLISWNDETDTIAKGKHFEELQPLLTVIQENY